MIHNTARLYGENIIGEGCIILENVIIGYPATETLQDIMIGKIAYEELKQPATSIGDHALIRSGTIIYSNVKIGRNFRTGHNALIRENTIIGDNVLIGSQVVIEGNAVIGNNVSIQSNAFIPVNSEIGDMVFIGPGAILTNEKYPAARIGNVLKGPVLRKGVSVGAGAVILPAIIIGEGSMIAAGAVVTRDVPEWHIAVGSPARIESLPDKLKSMNKL